MYNCLCLNYFTKIPLTCCLICLPAEPRIFAKHKYFGVSQPNLAWCVRIRLLCGIDSWIDRLETSGSVSVNHSLTPPRCKIGSSPMCEDGMWHLNEDDYQSYTP